MKKIVKDSMTLGGIGIGIGVGSAVTAKLGYGQSTFAAMGRMMPIASTAVMGTNVLRIAKKNLRRKK